MPLLAVVAVALRFEARRIKRVSLGADDYTIVVAMVRFPKNPYDTHICYLRLLTDGKVFAVALCVAMLAGTIRTFHTFSDPAC